MNKALVDLFYLISQALLAPVMLLILGAMMLVVVMLGQAAREGIERLLLGRYWRTFLRDIRQGKASPSVWKQAATIGLPAWLAKRIDDAGLASKHVKLLLPQGEVRAHRHLTKLQVLARVGPMLGLVGTLIPLGPALQGLSSSNLAEVGDNLNVAFTTTVFGIVVGGAAYALYHLYRSWYERDLSDLEYILALIEDHPNEYDANAPLESREGRRSVGGNGEPVRSLDRAGRGTDHRPASSDAVE